MTTTTEPLFAALRTCPKKVADGVWITHPETGDQLRVRRRFAEHHAEAYRAAALQHEAKNGPDTAKAADAEIDAAAMASGVIVDWRLAGNAERPYDAAAMTAVLLDPDYADLRRWINHEAERRANFRPDDAVKS